jgi:alcohol dehydrogenase class IV
LRFEFATATRIIIGPGTLGEIGPLAAAEGQRALVVTGKSSDRAERLFNALTAERIEHGAFPVAGEPTIEVAARGTEIARDAGCDFVIAFGGGSALDTGKAIAALLTNGGSPLDYLEVIGLGRRLTRPSAPFLAIPTTAGTGAEVTRNAVLGAPEQRVKVSLRSPFMLPRLALIDPELTYSLPSDITATTGLDALTQVLEPYVSRRANPLTNSLCQEGLHRAARSLRVACSRSNDKAARLDMAVTSLFGGLALANAGLGAVHGFAGPFGGMFSAPHGAVCACLLPHVMATNVAALKKRSPSSEVLRRYGDIARVLTGDQNAAAEDGVSWVLELCEELKVPPLSTYGFSDADFPALIEKASAASSMKGNPIELSSDEMIAILEHTL